MTIENTGLTGLPEQVAQEFHRCKDLLSDILREDELALWEQESLDLLRRSTRSREVALEYLGACPGVARSLNLPDLLNWLRSGRDLFEVASSLATAYFSASPSAIQYLRPRNVSRWAALGRSLYKGTWNSTTLATRFFQLSPDLLKHISFWDLEYFAGVLETLAGKSCDLACECMNSGSRLLIDMGNEKSAFLSLCRSISESSWREVRDVLAQTPAVLANLQGDQRLRFFQFVELLVRSGKQDVATLLREVSRTLEKVPAERRDTVFALAQSVMSANAEATLCLLRSLPQVVQRIGWDQVEPWLEAGVKLLKENHEAGLAYLRLESSTCERLMESLSSALDLERVRPIMQMYCRALAGEGVEISSAQELADRGIGWVAESTATTDGVKVYLPPVVDRYDDKRENFSWFKVIATHQTGHLEFNSFGLAFDKPSGLFQNMRWELAGNGHEPSAGPDPSGNNGHKPLKTGMARFFDLFQSRQLALDVFTAVEDSRLDYRIKAEYAGLAAEYSRAQREALRERPPVEELPLRQALIEMLIRLSLDQHEALPVPRDLMKVVDVLAKIVGRLRDTRATVEDSAEAAIRVYAILSLLPNQLIDPDRWDTRDVDLSQAYSEEEFRQLLEELRDRFAEGRREETEEVEYDSPQEVEFRGGFKPEMVQILQQLRMLKPDEISPEDLEELLKNSVELETKSEPDKEMQDLIKNLMKEAGRTRERKDEGQGAGAIGHVEEQGGELEATDDLTSTYDEWDFRACDYKPNWCMVHEKRMEEGDIRFFDGVMREYSSLMAEIKRQFEMILPERLQKVHRIEDGEDLDLDAAIEAQIDRRLGGTPSEKVYWRRNKLERDVAVAFLVDMSASTAEAVEDTKVTPDLSGAPAGPAAPVQPRPRNVRRNYKRIIDIEKESTALLIQALETIGDTYGIYGFSGYGRENVEFYVIKDVNEVYSDKVKQRLDKMSPLHATRMGPAVRHAIGKLDKQDAKTKFLFLISDGRPQDRGYSREGVERDYAVHDTHQALVEARQKGIVPFCLTVDKNGHDYLKAMCGDMGYEVLSDIRMLPQRLPMLYKKLTAFPK